MGAFRSRIVLGVAASLIAGCTKTVVVVPHAMPCGVDADLLARKCSAPQPIPKDATFATLIDFVHEDRQALRECGMSHDALRQSIEKCNAEIARYNKEIDDINKK